MTATEIPQEMVPDAEPATTPLEEEVVAAPVAEADDVVGAPLGSSNSDTDDDSSDDGAFEDFVSGYDDFEDFASGYDGFEDFARGYDDFVALLGEVPEEPDETYEGDDELADLAKVVASLKDKGETEADEGSSSDDGELEEFANVIDSLQDRKEGEGNGVDDDSADREVRDFVDFVDFLDVLRSRAREAAAAVMSEDPTMEGDGEFAEFLDCLQSVEELAQLDAASHVGSVPDSEYAAFLNIFNSPPAVDAVEYTPESDAVWRQIVEGMSYTDRVGFVGWLLGAKDEFGNDPPYAAAGGDVQTWIGCLRAWWTQSQSPEDEKSTASEWSEARRSFDVVEAVVPLEVEDRV